MAGLTEDASGNFFGTTESGGGFGWCTVFKLAPNGDGSYSESVLYSFCAQSSGSIACADGSPPQGDLIEDASGNFYGTTNGGGPNAYGTVFKLTPPPLASRSRRTPLH
jgi:uncharacterized repeat protein (TIGR03803 family)